jgi:uncharacterized protein YbaR (Trm112 family)
MTTTHPHNNKPFYSLLVAVGLLLLALLIGVLSGCNTAKRLDIIHAKKEPLTASKCGLWYPIKDSIHEVVKTDTNYIYDGYTTYDCDSAVKSLTELYGEAGIQQGKTIKVPYPVLRTITVHDTFTHWRENTAKIVSQSDSIKTLIMQCTIAEKDKHFYKTVAFYSFGILLLIVVITIFYYYLKLKAKAV